MVQSTLYNVRFSKDFVNMYITKSIRGKKVGLESKIIALTIRVSEWVGGGGGHGGKAPCQGFNSH
jgi:hypothetical protein